MIDPENITAYERTTTELEEFLLNAITFAGKNARQQAQKMHELLFHEYHPSPFHAIRMWKKRGTLRRKLERVRIGKYSLLCASFSELAHSAINLKTCTVEELVKFPGIGHKTARLFILHSRRRQEIAVIDTHLLKEMRHLKLTNLRATPTDKKYFELEKKLIAHLKKNGITDFAEYDLATWKKYSKGSKIT